MPRKNGAHAAQPQERCTCKRCSHTVPVELMAKRGEGKRAAICKRCDNARRKAIYWADPEAARAKRRELRLRNIERERARGRERARSARGRELNRAAVRRYQERHPERVAAQHQARVAVRRGELKRPRCCQALGCTRTDRLHLHHNRYDRPLAVEALCHLDHERAHHASPVRLKKSAAHRWARAPQHQQA
jgi:hypothetical protein